ncbi:MAG: hypothetical protein HW384_2240 [Dehalococcoidia bacterium]|nr:hypothetical protein [Dehalococcoidia bacterium]
MLSNMVTTIFRYENILGITLLDNSWVTIISSTHENAQFHVQPEVKLIRLRVLVGKLGLRFCILTGYITDVTSIYSAKFLL